MFESLYIDMAAGFEGYIDNRQLYRCSWQQLLGVFLFGDWVTQLHCGNVQISSLFSDIGRVNDLARLLSCRGSGPCSVYKFQSYGYDTKQIQDVAFWTFHSWNTWYWYACNILSFPSFNGSPPSSSTVNSSCISLYGIWTNELTRIDMRSSWCVAGSNHGAAHVCCPDFFIWYSRLPLLAMSVENTFHASNSAVTMEHIGCKWLKIEWCRLIGL